MELLPELLQDKRQEHSLGFAASVRKPISEEFGIAQASQLSTCIGGRVGGGDALGREVGVPHYGRAVRVG